MEIVVLMHHNIYIVHHDVNQVKVWDSRLHLKACGLGKFALALIVEEEPPGRGEQGCGYMQSVCGTAGDKGSHFHGGSAGGSGFSK
jgi:hypothetical protein